MTLYLTRLRVSRRPSARAVAALISPRDATARIDAHHKLVWAAFADGPERARDFLWREEDDGSFLTLSARPPLPMDLFEPFETKPFAPVLAPGERLSFALRANATRARRGAGRVDVVMDALHARPVAERAAARPEVAQQEGAAWLARQGESAGFTPLSVTVEGYATHALPGHRGPRKGQPQFGILDMSGVLEVTDPAAFCAQLAQGFGRAKAFGCGLMLIRRAR
ncbi:type I-E CRISPR-associated protein Cas6/Cse3/CasE [Pseudodonghicola xiamenensis]|uniref:Type I-E CRISPR-associated protein Cas6/Cse3/CasE n=1 Tax=Pseudodonghicola xiamenensis TaxID=337702 RepID=A0A8J3MEJ7_9RHOB|nr:type I-E CRISPR-associated protein Cas6/Cse3/CasE [Pseudodonghicola xiamenensis]GHG98395.1 type I-E CRISPR-associated protein Cas6/Cse3/CasE [Pseudodonghicola xiamenensis]